MWSLARGQTTGDRNFESQPVVVPESLHPQTQNRLFKKAASNCNRYKCGRRKFRVVSQAAVGHDEQMVIRQKSLGKRNNYRHFRLERRLVTQMADQVKWSGRLREVKNNRKL